jgi:succinate dehydrogenase / fumarate reductase, cytochrome b subunit
MENPIGVKAGGLAFLVKRWIFPFKRSLGTWAFVFNRWSGVLLAIYLYVHIGVLTATIAFNQNAYNQFLVIARSPIGIVFDAGLLMLMLYHALNGFRIGYAALSGKIEQHRGQFWTVVVLAVALTAYSMFLILTLE